jgi:phenylalanyl-tRNA synthetase alpha chain
MESQLATLEAESATYLEQINSSKSQQDLDQIRVKLLGRNGIITQLLKSLNSLDPDNRKVQGSKLNVIKIKTMQATENKKSN